MICQIINYKNYSNIKYMIYLNNLREGVIRKISSSDKIIYQDEINKNNYDIQISRTELNNLIFALNIIITDIKNNQNRNYIISEIENVITKLKNADVPPKKDFTTVPTFSTVDLKIEKKNSNFLTPGMSQDSFFDNKTYISDAPQGSPSNNLEKYEGPMINGKKEGKGVYTYQNGCRYEGYFKNDKKEGSGIFYYANGDRYKGNFHEGNYHGNGIFYFNNGDRYEGGFSENKYFGKGNYFYHNGDRFEGNWLNDKKNGEGIYFYLNGDKIVGNYKDGKPFGTHIKYSKDGGTFRLNYSKA